MAKLILLLIGLAGTIFFLISPPWLAPHLFWLNDRDPREDQ